MFFYSSSKILEHNRLIFNNNETNKSSKNLIIFDKIRLQYIWRALKTIRESIKNKRNIIERDKREKNDSFKLLY